LADGVGSRGDIPVLVFAPRRQTTAHTCLRARLTFEQARPQHERHRALCPAMGRQCHNAFSCSTFKTRRPWFSRSTSHCHPLVTHAVTTIPTYTLVGLRAAVADSRGCVRSGTDNFIHRGRSTSAGCPQDLHLFLYLPLPSALLDCSWRRRHVNACATTTSPATTAGRWQHGGVISACYLTYYCCFAAHCLNIPNISSAPMPLHYIDGT